MWSSKCTFPFSYRAVLLHGCMMGHPTWIEDMATFQHEISRVDMESGSFSEILSRLPTFETPCLLCGERQSTRLNTCVLNGTRYRLAGPDDALLEQATLDVHSDDASLRDKAHGGSMKSRDSCHRGNSWKSGTGAAVRSSKPGRTDRMFSALSYRRTAWMPCAPSVSPRWRHISPSTGKRWSPSMLSVCTACLSTPVIRWRIFNALTSS